MALTEGDRSWFERQLKAFEAKLVEALRSELALTPEQRRALARALGLTPEQRSAIARKAGLAGGRGRKKAE